MKEYKLVQTETIDEAGINDMAQHGWQVVATYPLAVSFNRIANNWLVTSMLVFERDVSRDETQETQQTSSHPKTRRRSRKPTQPA